MSKNNQPTSTWLGYMARPGETWHRVCSADSEAECERRLKRAVADGRKCQTCVLEEGEDLPQLPPDVPQAQPASFRRKVLTPAHFRGAQ